MPLFISNFTSKRRIHYKTVYKKLCKYGLSQVSSCISEKECSTDQYGQIQVYRAVCEWDHGWKAGQGVEDVKGEKKVG